MLIIFQILTFVLHQQEEICLCDCENTVGGTPWSEVRETHATGAREQGEYKLMKTNDEGRGVCAEGGEEREQTRMQFLFSLSLPLNAQRSSHGRRLEWEFGISTCKMLYTEWINKVLLYSGKLYSISCDKA